MTFATQAHRESFSNFNFKEACKYLGITELKRWTIEAEPVPISDFFRQRLDRLQVFDLEAFEVAWTLLVDAICEEGLIETRRLKVWKGAYLEGEDVCGNADYLIAEKRAYLEAPFVCVIEANRKDFQQGVAQCLVEMRACQQANQQLGRVIDIYGIVTNGDGWQFYRLTVEGQVSESPLYGTGGMSILLGTLRTLFRMCEQSLD